MTSVAPTIDVPLTLEEVEALIKTGGIAIQNLMSKASKVGPSSSLGRIAIEEQTTLIGVQQKLFSVIQEANAA